MLLTTEEGFDLLYISIAAFNNLCQNFAGTLDNWGVQVIYVDEFHLALTECYRHATSVCMGVVMFPSKVDDKLF